MHRMSSSRLHTHFYADGRRDGTRAFYGWLRESLRAEMRVLNVGAGPATKAPLRIIKGEVSSVVGADIDPLVLENEELDQAVVIKDAVLPFAKESFDLAYADYVLEHVEEPRPFLTEIQRVLKPGASFLFRTPNRNHYVALGSRMTPHWMHRLVANRMRGLPSNSHDPWPTVYRLNSRAQIERFAVDAGFRGIEIRMFEADPSYLVFSSLAFLAGVAYERVVNSTELLAAWRVNIFGKLTKP